MSCMGVKVEEWARPGRGGMGRGRKGWKGGGGAGRCTMRGLGRCGLRCPGARENEVYAFETNEVAQCCTAPLTPTECEGPRKTLNHNTHSLTFAFAKNSCNTLTFLPTADALLPTPSPLSSSPPALPRAIH